jgi:hypothetical protein
MSMAPGEGRPSFRERLQMKLSACRWREEDASPNVTIRSCTMITVQERSMLAGLEARRAALHSKLSQVDLEIRKTEQGQARIEERIKELEQGRREAA